MYYYYYVIIIITIRTIIMSRAVGQPCYILYYKV
jgi:hypothetical protein